MEMIYPLELLKWIVTVKRSEITVRSEIEQLALDGLEDEIMKMEEMRKIKSRKVRIEEYERQLELEQNQQAMDDYFSQFDERLEEQMMMIEEQEILDFHVYEDQSEKEKLI